LYDSKAIQLRIEIPDLDIHNFSFLWSTTAAGPEEAVAQVRATSQRPGTARGGLTGAQMSRLRAAGRIRPTPQLGAKLCQRLDVSRQVLLPRWGLAAKPLTRDQVMSTKGTDRSTAQIRLGLLKERPVIPVDTSLTAAATGRF